MFWSNMFGNFNGFNFGMRYFHILEMALGYSNGPLAYLKDYILSLNKRNFKLISLFDILKLHRKFCQIK